MKLATLILTLIGCTIQARADLVIEAEATDVPYQVKVLIINKGDKAVTFDFPSPECYPEFHTWSPFHWRIQSDKPLPIKEGPTVPRLGEWSTTHVISSRAYLSDEWNALFESKTLAPSERVSYTGDLRKIMPFFDWDKVHGEVTVEFKYLGKSLKDNDPLVSKPLKIKL
jgi:hypothetical protein